ncbi:hypothetical protein FHG66_11350 [Rubellimicrobium rubrum]|uniref:Uncharacterized protein n=1 Tax=Rubellimicrobium rubrum TaxID=2585369 RepID=A0A5C4MY08_9RHOB|nr:hypothetical protein [Rubellimicrobium rubrum]TNC49321.1 hypothetical protein FHG66_11350 [Rubellimicrobium rubrum]
MSLWAEACCNGCHDDKPHSERWIRSGAMVHDLEEQDRHLALQIAVEVPAKEDIAVARDGLADLATAERITGTTLFLAAAVLAGCRR